MASRDERPTWSSFPQCGATTQAQLVSSRIPAGLMLPSLDHAGVHPDVMTQPATIMRLQSCWAECELHCRGLVVVASPRTLMHDTTWRSWVQWARDIGAVSAPLLDKPLQSQAAATN